MAVRSAEVLRQFLDGGMSPAISDEVLSASMTEFRRMKGLNTSFEAGIVVVEAPDPAVRTCLKLLRNIANKGTFIGHEVFLAQH
jgi:hypothetical protein